MVVTVAKLRRWHVHFNMFQPVAEIPTDGLLMRPSAVLTYIGSRGTDNRVSADRETRQHYTAIPNCIVAGTREFPTKNRQFKPSSQVTLICFLSLFIFSAPVVAGIVCEDVRIFVRSNILITVYKIIYQTKYFISVWLFDLF